MTRLALPFLLAFTIVLALEATVPGDETLWLFAPSNAEATLSRTSSASVLIGRFGRENLRFAQIHGRDGENPVMPGAFLFPDDPSRRVELVWQDGSKRGILERARVRGDHGQWRVAPGITLGTPLLELQRINGRPFSFLGFGFDHGGRVTSWARGRLKALEDQPRVELRLLQSPGAPDLEATTGDRDLTSDMSELSKLRPFVWEMTAFY